MQHPPGPLPHIPRTHSSSPPIPKFPKLCLQPHPHVYLPALSLRLGVCLSVWFVQSVLFAGNFSCLKHWTWQQQARSRKKKNDDKSTDQPGIKGGRSEGCWWWKGIKIGRESRHTDKGRRGWTRRTKILQGNLCSSFHKQVGEQCINSGARRKKKITKTNKVDPTTNAPATKETTRVSFGSAVPATWATDRIDRSDTLSTVSRILPKSTTRSQVPDLGTRLVQIWPQSAPPLLYIQSTARPVVQTSCNFYSLENNSVVRPLISLDFAWNWPWENEGSTYGSWRYW